MTNEEVIKLFTRDQERRGLIRATIEKRQVCLRAFSRAHAGRSFFEVTREDIELFLDGRNIGARTRYTWISHLHCLYSWAIDQEMVTFDPTARIVRPRLRRGLPRPASSAELRAALKGATPTQRCWILLAAYEGLRCQEIGGLRREDILENEGLLRVVHGKGGHERLLPLHPEVYEALRALPLPRQGWVFKTPTGGRYNNQYVSFNFNEALRNLGVDATAHQVRHLFATLLYAKTRDLRVVQEMMGHASPQTTAVYAAFDHVTATAGVHGLSLGGPEAA